CARYYGYDGDYAMDYW
nr:immunoglobulin heavy chain junction region [Mus musculus]